MKYDKFCETLLKIIHKRYLNKVEPLINVNELVLETSTSISKVEKGLQSLIEERLIKFELITVGLLSEITGGQKSFEARITKKGFEILK